MIELGRIDISTQVYMLSSHNSYSCEVNFYAALHVMSYLKGRHNLRISLGPSYSTIEHKRFKDNYWTEFYVDVEESISPNVPTPLVNSFYLHMMVDSDYAGDKLIRRSRTGFMIFCNMDLINWLSKKHLTVEIAVFGNDFFAMKHGVETLRGLKYKLMMMDVPIEEPIYIYSDNMSIIYNT